MFSNFKNHSIFLLLLAYLISVGGVNAQQFELLYDTPEENNFIDVIEEDSSFLLISNEGKRPNFTPRYLRISKSGQITFDSLDQSLKAAIVDVIELDSSYILIYNSNSLDSLWGVEVDRSLKKTKRILFSLKDSIDPWFYANGKLSNDRKKLIISGTK